jgi:two-component system response regulator (stage 0 sporulation protein F)
LNPSGQKRVLVIDDDPAIRLAIKTALEQVGYDVEGSDLLPVSIGASLTGDYHLITLDMRMPGMGGEEIAEMLSTCCVITPVLVISGYLEESAVAYLRELGIKHFLDKPFTIPDLLQAVEDAISGKTQSS